MVKREALGTLLAFITALISGFAIFANKIFVTGLDPLVFTAVRAIIIGLIFFALSSFQFRLDFRQFKKVRWKYLLAIGLIGGSLAFLLFFTGLKLTTSGRAAFLHKTLPLYITLLAVYFLKEKVGKKQLVALILMMLGTFIIFSAKINPSEFWMNPSLGDALVVGATMLWAVENVIARKVLRKRESNLIVSFGRMFFGGLILFGVMLLAGKWELLFTLTSVQITNILISTAILFGYVLFYYWSIKHINVSKAATVLLLSPVITLMLGSTFLGEPVPPLQIIGSAAILIGAYLIVGVRSEFERI
jgi:drug/metabolite transporter (DMT)-like permease